MLTVIPSCIGSYDSCVHISEEATNATTAVPWAIVSLLSAFRDRS